MFTAVKAALALQGIDCGAVRPPGAWPLTEKQQSRLKTFMLQNNLIS